MIRSRLEADAGCHERAGRKSLRVHHEPAVRGWPWKWPPGRCSAEIIYELHDVRSARREQSFCAAASECIAYLLSIDCSFDRLFSKPDRRESLNPVLTSLGVWRNKARGDRLAREK